MEDEHSVKEVYKTATWKVVVYTSGRTSSCVLGAAKRHKQNSREYGCDQMRELHSWHYLGSCSS